MTRAAVAMPGYSENLKYIFKHSDAYERLRCASCRLLLKDAVQIACGHRLCQSCADYIIKTQLRAQAKCPECDEPVEDEDGTEVSHALWSLSCMVACSSLACQFSPAIAVLASSVVSHTSS